MAIDKRVKTVVKKVDDVMETIKRVKGEEYLHIVAINTKVNSAITLVQMLPLPPRDKAALTLMVTSLGADIVGEWERDKDKEVLKKYAETLEADVTALMKLMEDGEHA